MPTISAIEPQKKRQNRFNLFLDGQFSLSISQETLVRYHVKVGQQLDQPLLEEIVKGEQYAALFNRALHFLSYRPRSEKEVRDFLKRITKRESDSIHAVVVESVMSKLAEIGQVDDLAFAKWFVESRLRARPKGVRLLKMELAQKGVDREVVDEAVSIVQKEQGHEGNIDEVELAYRAVAKKAPGWQKLDARRFREKVTGFLGRRGFDWDTIKAVIDRLRPGRV